MTGSNQSQLSGIWMCIYLDFKAGKGMSWHQGGLGGDKSIVGRTEQGESDKQQVHFLFG